MSRIDDVLGNAAQAVDTAVRRMPEREARTVETRSARKSAMTGIGAVLAVVVIGILGWMLLGDGGADFGPIDEPDGAPAPVLVDPDAESFGTFFSGRAGTYRAEPMGGVAFSFTLAADGEETPWVRLRRSPWETGLSHPDSQGNGDRELIFMTAKRLSDPETLRAPTWPVDDIDGWLAALDPDVLVEGPTDVVVAGRPALSFTLGTTDEPCDFSDLAPGEEILELPCDTLAYAEDGEGGQLFMDSSVSEYLVWWVPGVDGDAAFVAFAAVFGSDRAEWEPVVASVVDSLGIGE
jgi:hypothetical protein